MTCLSQMRKVSLEQVINNLLYYIYNIIKAKKQTKNKNYKIQYDIQLMKNEYQMLIKDAKETKQKTSIKRLNKSSLDIFKSHLKNLENTDVEVQHLNSRLQYQLARSDTPHLSANGRCNTTQHCKVSYVFKIKQVPEDNLNYVPVEVVVFDKHDHEKKSEDKIQVRGEKNRKQLGEKIMVDHGGSSYEARLTDLASKGA